MSIAQLRGTIFIPQTISFTPESASMYSELILPGAKAYNATPPELIAPGLNPNTPQYGAPWRLFKKCGEEGEYNIVFLSGKIDIILTKDDKYESEIEESFCNKCIEWFKAILLQNQDSVVSRIAYAPMYAIEHEDRNLDTIWGHLLKNTMIDGTLMQDVNLSFLLKRQLTFNSRDIQMNLLYNISDGMKIKQIGDSQETQSVVLLQLDMNSISESPLKMNSDGIADFFHGILKIKERLIDDVTEQF